jgi:release factor glutamine methyltransferase
MRMATSILQSSSFIAARGGIESEVEQLVIGAYRKATGRGRTFGRDDLYVRVMEPYPREAGEKLVVLANRRADGEPLQYLLGWQTFLNHEYEVDPSVLIPRPETEILDYEVPQAIKRRIDQPTLGLEIGLGSGCISIELLKLFGTLRMVATEISESAIALATRNAAKILGAGHEERLEILRAADRSAVFEPLSHAGTRIWRRGERADFIVSNPPYLAHRSEIDEDVLKHEPHEALFAPEGDALYFYRRIVEEAEAYLKPKGSVFFECPHERISEIAGLFAKDWKVTVYQDLASRPRVVQADWSGISTLN